MDWVRLVVVALALCSLAAMTVHYGAVENDRAPHTTAADLGADYDGHVGDRAYFWARVAAVEDGGIRVDNYAVPLFVATDTTDTAPGDFVQVYGTVRPDNRIDAERVVVHEQSERRYLFAVSGLGGLLAAGAVLWYWRIDWRTLTVHPREGEP